MQMIYTDMRKCTEPEGQNTHHVHELFDNHGTILADVLLALQ